MPLTIKQGLLPGMDENTKSPLVKRRRRTTSSRVTMADVARKAGVSGQTVSRVLHQPELVGEEVALRVRDAIESLQYVPNLAASQMASNRSGIVAAIIPSISSSVFADTIQALSDTLVPAGYQILLGNTEYDPDREEELVRSFLGRGPDGIMLASTHHNPSLIKLLSRSRLPVVETWDWLENPIDLLVGYSNERASYQMVRYLGEKGYRKIVFAGVTNVGDYRAEARLQGYQAAIKAMGLDKPRVLTLAGQPLTMQVGAQTLISILEQYPDADAIFFSSDVFASGALLECTRRGIAVPKQLAIAGFGDFEIAKNLVPSLTTVSVHAAQIGQNAAELLLARMENNPIDNKCIDVGFELIFRQST